MCLKTYIVQYTHSNGNGWAIINCPSPSFIENILKKQSKMLNVQVVSYNELRYFGEEMGLVYEGCITTIGQSPYDIAVANGFRGSVTEWLQSLVGPEGSKGDKGDTGEKGDKGDKGDRGDKGNDGIGVPAGGNVGQYLKKKSNSDYDTEWSDVQGGGSGNVNSVNGKTGNVVLSAADIDALPSNTPLFSGNYNDLTNKPTIPTVPANISAFNNDAGYITTAVNNLLNYYLKSEIYTKSEVENLIGAIQNFHFEIYTSTSDVTSPTSNVLYLIGPTGSGSDKYEEYVYDSTKQEPWVKIGDTSIDLSDYYTKGQTNTAITNALNVALANYTTTEALRLLLAGKQDVINDLATIRSGAALGTTAVQTETDPTVPAWAKQASKPTYTSDEIDDTNTTNKFVTEQDKTTWNNKQDTLVSGTNIKTINNQSIIGSGNIEIQGGGSYVPTLQSAPTSSTISYVKDGVTKNFEVGNEARVIDGNDVTFYKLINIVTENNVTTATWIEEQPDNTAYFSSDNGVGIVPSDGIIAESVTSAATMSINPDVVTVIDGSVGTAAITLQVPNDNLAHVWSILMTTGATPAITFVMSNNVVIRTPSGFSVGASKAVEISVIGVGSTYYLRYGEFA